MIIGNGSQVSSIPDTTAKFSLAGSKTRTVGYHSTPNLGPAITTYDGSDELMLERVR